ncbi:MAG: hypothetical protein LBP35_02545 [Candidatus Ancillula trichonymphae]|nr:hypothetical protein [Candidatus Ancillula trichonymphae]
MRIKIGASVDFTKFALLLLWIAVIYLLNFMLRSISGWDFCVDNFRCWTNSPPKN